MPSRCFFVQLSPARESCTTSTCSWSINRTWRSRVSDRALRLAVTRYFAENGKVRVGGAGAKTVYLIEDRTVYAIDEGSQSVRVLKHATLSEVAAHYTDAVRQLQEAAATAPPENRAEAQRKASDLKAASDRLLQPVPRAYGMTARFESVDGHSCRIWEERESGVKRLELCVAPTAAVAGGADLLNGMHVLVRLPAAVPGGRSGSISVSPIGGRTSSTWAGCRC